MTTVVVDIKNKKAYSDSRVTRTNIKTGITTYGKTKDKLIKHKNKNSLCILTGNIALIKSKLKCTGFNTAFKGEVCSYESGESCHIIVLQKDSKIASVVTGRVLGGKISWNYNTFCDEYIYTGSGSVTKEAQKVSRYLSNGIKLPPESIIRAASINDIHTDDTIRMEAL